LIGKEKFTEILRSLQREGFQCQPTESFSEDILKFKHYENFTEVVEPNTTYVYQFGPAGYFLKVREQGKGRIGFISLVSKKEITCWISANYMPLWRGTPTDCFDFGEYNRLMPLKDFICVWNIYDEPEFDHLANEIVEVLKKEDVHCVIEVDCSGF